jgi:threonylcarbamoyladenosine tRNA methylthiotransferase MtaB
MKWIEKLKFCSIYSQDKKIKICTVVRCLFYMKKYTYKIYTLGCKVNQYDSNNLEAILAVNGFESVKANAQVAIVNTCAVTESAIRGSIRKLNLAKKENPEAKLVLTGCVGELEKNDELLKPIYIDIYIDLIWGTKDYQELNNKIIEIFGSSNSKNTIVNYKELVKQNKRSRYTIKIQDGCEQFCTYCVIPHTRGKIKSRGKDDIINEIKEVIKVGYEEIVLSGIHLGLYGKDLYADKSLGIPLVDLIKKIIVLPGLGRIRLSSIELNEVTDELIELVKTNKVCSHLHIPLQAGTNKILKLMNRPYTLDEFKTRIKNIRKQIPNIAITTDVIVGFPGETEEDFKETYNTIKELKFSRLHVFPFSPHKLTPASQFKDQVPENTKKERAKKLRVLGYKLAQDYRDKFKGKKLAVVIVNEKDGKYLGKTEYYFDIWFDANSLIDGDNKINNGKLVLIKN